MSEPSIDIIARFTDTIVSAVLAELGEENVRSVFVGGSTAGGETSSCLTDDGLEIYSDVDLYVVVADGVDAEDARRRARVAASRVALDGDGYVFFRAPDVGVYTIEDLASQPARPGTVGLDKKHRILYGDPEVPSIAAARIGTDIAETEALYLIENRLTELAALENERRESERDDRYFAFVLCKTGLDVGTASLVFHGEYSPVRAERLERLAEMSRRDGSEWQGDRFDLLRRCSDALEIMPSPDWSKDVTGGRMALDIVSLALTQWRQIAADVFAIETMDWSKLVLRRCQAGQYARNFRQFRAMNTRCGFRQRGTLAAGIHLSRYSPVDALRLSALTEYLQRAAAAETGVDRLVEMLGSFLDRLTRVCGFSNGSLGERSIEMYRAVQ